MTNHIQMATSRTFQNLLTSTTYSDTSDITKKLSFDLSGATTSTTTTFDLNSTATRTVTFPDATDTLVGRDTTDTLTNKTLTTPIISQISNTGTLTLPTATTTLVGTDTTDTLSNKTLDAPLFDNGFTLNDADDSHTYTFSPGALTSAATLTLPSDGAFDSDFTQELVIIDGLQTLTKKTLTSPTVATPTFTNAALTFKNAGDDVTLTVASQSSASGSFTLPDLNGATSDIVVTNVAQTLTNKTLTAPQINDTSADHQYIVGVSELAADRTITLPLLTGNDTFVFEAFAQTLSNKTLTAPQINDTSEDHQYIFGVSELTANRTITLPLLTGNDTFVFEAHTQTLTNKTLTSPVLTTPQINDTSEDHQYVFAVSELAADRTVTLPLLTGNDTFVFEDHSQTLSNKTLASVESIGGAAGQNLVITPPAGFNVTISGDLDVTGTTTSIDSVNVNIADRYLYLNKDYTTNAAVTSGLVVNHTPTTTSSAVAGAAFGSTTTVVVADGTGFATDDIIQISSANNVANDGIFEIASVATNTITIKSSPAEDFIQTAFTADGTVAGTVTKISVCVLRVGTDDIWEAACGSSTPLVYNDLLTTSTADSVTTATAATTDATVTEIANIATSSDTSYLIDADIIARETADSDESAAYKLRAHYRNDGGTLTQVGGDDLTAFESTLGWNVATEVDGTVTTQINITVQGAAATNVSWSTSYKVRSI